MPLALALALLSAPVWAQATATAADASRISTVTLYPGSATVQRVLRLPAGATRAVFGCLPAQLDARSLQLASSGDVRIGEVSVQVVDRQVASGCTSALDERLRAAEDEVASARAAAEALELAQTWLKTQAGSAPGTDRESLAPARIAATLEALRRSSQDTLTQLHQAQRTLQERELALKRVQAEQGSVQAPKVAMVRVTLAAPAAADLHLTYQVRGPSWGPSYRARLDTRSDQVQLERQALVSQATGEDWRGVQLTLSTGQPLAATQGPLPRPWTLDVPPPEPPMAKTSRAASAGLAMAPAPAPAPMAEAAPPSFDVVTTEGAYATQFAVPQRVDVPSGGERVTLTLGSQKLAATLLARTTPALASEAWLVALLPPLSGTWPTGPVTLERDGASVGQSRFAPQASDFARIGLAFGRDEQIIVAAEPLKEFTESKGFTGSRTERGVQRAYEITNRHREPVTVQVLDAAPISKNEAITVTSSYEPAPQSSAWGAQPGTIVWQQPLAAGASARFSARHVISHDKDVQVRERH